MSSFEKSTKQNAKQDAKATGYPEWAHVMYNMVYDGLSPEERPWWRAEFHRAAEGVTDWKSVYSEVYDVTKDTLWNILSKDEKEAAWSRIANGFLEACK